jgi:uncharacterized protein YndB with AHSA1/START domain
VISIVKWELLWICEGLSHKGEINNQEKKLIKHKIMKAQNSSTSGKKEEEINTLIQPAAKAEMLIRKPVSEVFEAMVNPDITSKFWFTKGSGRLEEGKTIEWVWEMYDFKQSVYVHQIEQNNFISLTWSATNVKTTVEITFTPKNASSTFVSIIEKGWNADDGKLFQYLVGNTEGWALVLSALKALLEHNVVLTVVADRYPDGFEF